MYEAKHRALVRRRPSSKSVTVVGVATLAVAAVFGPSAYADTHSPFTHDNTSTWVAPGHGKPANHGKPGKPGKPDKPDADDTTESGAATNGGHALPGDSGLTNAQLNPTAQPLTPYEMPFPCGEVWSGSTRNGHTPSVRAVDFNYAGGDLGKPVVAAASGTVVTAVTGRNRPSYGQYVVIDHGNGESTLYGHLDSVLVTVGQTVTAGTQLGTVGDTGNADGSHLHFEERLNGAVVDAWFHGAQFPMNSSGASQNCGTVPVNDIPLAGNLYGSKAAEMMLFRRATPAAYHVTRLGRGEQVIKMGTAADQPVLGDWDGNGRVNPGVRTPATRIFELRVRGKDQTIRFGKRGDLPVAGNWDGVGAWEVGVRRPGSAKFLLRAADGTVTRVALGDADDLPVTGDWNADGVTDLGVFDAATAVFTLRTVDVTGTEVLTSVQFGTPGLVGVVPVVGDWDGNAITDLGTWNPDTQTFYHRDASSPASKHEKLGRVQFRAGDVPRSPRLGR
jgi:murein DD-endopeptidase MepM/ murein hydrolase activator NlpD